MSDDFKKIKDAIEDENIIKLLVDKFGKETVDSILDYFNDKLNSFLESHVENYINDNLKDILDIINVNRLSNDINNVISNTNTNDNDRSIAAVHLFGNSYSGELAIGILDDEIKKAEIDIKELERVIRENEIKDKKLRIELERKKVLLTILSDNRKELSENESYDNKTTIGDEKIRDVEMQLKQRQEELAGLSRLNQNDRRTQRVIDRNKLKLEKEINKLKAKKVNIMASQRKITNKRLMEMYKSSNKTALRDVKREERNKRLEDTRKRFENEKEKYSSEMSRLDSNAISRKISGVKYLVSYHKYNVVEKYCSLLKLKDGAVNGVRKLPDNIKQIINNNMQITVSVGLSR